MAEPFRLGSSDPSSLVCSHEWRAPFLFPSGEVSYSRKICIEPKGHDGPHRSWDKVIEAKKRKE